MTAFYEVNLPAEFNRERYKPQLQITYFCNYNYEMSFYKYPSESVHKTLNYKPVQKLPDKCTKKKVNNCDS